MYRMPQMGYRPYPQTPPPPQQGMGFGHGVKQFIDTYRGEQAAKKDQARQLFDQHIKMMEAGIPVDKKKMAKWAREADLHFDMDPPPPPPAQAPMTPDPKMQQAAQVGMQQSLGGPQMAAPPPQAPPQQPGFMNRLGAAMGVPQPPTQAQEIGVMRMLNDLQSRGQQNAQAQQMQRDMAMKGLEAMKTIEQGMGMGLTMEDPRMAQALRTMMLLRGMQGGDMGAVGKVAESEMVQKLFPNLMKRMEEETSTAKKAEERMKFRSGVASKLNPEQAIEAESWVFGEAKEAPKFSTVDSGKLNASVQKLVSEYPSASPEKIREAALLLFSKDADPADLARAFSKGNLGESVTQTRMGMQKEQLGLSKRSAARADEQLGRTRKDDAESEEVEMAAGQILQLAGGDPDAAYENAMNLAFAAFGGDRKKATQYLPAIQKRLKDLTSSASALEKLLSK